MDIPAMSMAMSQAELHREVNAAVAKMSMEQVEDSKDQFMELLDSASLEQVENLEVVSDPNLGKNLDLMM